MATLAIFMAFWMGFAPLSAAAMVMRDALLLVLFLVELQVVNRPRAAMLPPAGLGGKWPPLRPLPTRLMPHSFTLSYCHECPVSDRVQVGEDSDRDAAVELGEQLE